MASVTISPSDPQHIFVATVVDSTNNPIPGDNGEGYTWTEDSNGALCTLSPNVQNVTLRPTGQVGTLNLKCVATKSNAAPVSGVLQVVIQGPVRDHVNIAMQS